MYLFLKVLFTENFFMQYTLLKPVDVSECKGKYENSENRGPVAQVYSILNHWQV